MIRYLWLLLPMSLSACIAVGPRYEEPQPDKIQDAFVYSDDPAFLIGEEKAPGPWWSAYSDPRIGEAVDLALERNRDLAAAYGRLEAAQARAGAARAALLPQGGTSFAITRQQQAQAAFAGFAGVGDGEGEGPPPVPRDNPEFTIYQAAAEATWEIDLFGRLRRQAQGARARAEQQEALYQDTRRLIAGRTVDTYLLLVEAMNRRKVALENLAIQQRALELTGQLFELGEVPQLNLLQQETLVKTTAAQVKQVESAAADATAALALVMGMTVPEFLVRFPGLVAEDAAPPLPRAEGLVIVGQPGAILRRRPDIAAAERALAAEVYDIGLATAELFPSVQLVGSGSLTALDFAGLGEDQAVGYSVGPRLSWQILSYPRLLLQRAASKAEAEAALAAYEQTVLQALTETDRALALHSGAVVQAELLSEADRNARQALSLVEARYREGADSLLSLLDAQRTALQTQDQAVQAQAAALRTRASVHRVLAQ
jgi:NodT family efflux transporter outer membrane factor (OMF) lipoprotein